MSIGIYPAVTDFVPAFRNESLVKALIRALVFCGGFSFLVWLGFVKLMSVPISLGALW